MSNDFRDGLLVVLAGTRERKRRKIDDECRESIVELVSGLGGGGQISHVDHQLGHRGGDNVALDTLGREIGEVDHKIGNVRQGGNVALVTLAGKIGKIDDEFRDFHSNVVGGRNALSGSGEVAEVDDKLRSVRGVIRGRLGGGARRGDSISFVRDNDHLGLFRPNANQNFV